MSSIAITIAAEGQGLTAAMDDRFGRAPRFLVVDADTGEVQQTVSNPAVQAAHGAGTGAAALMREQGVAAVISGRFGPKAFEALRALGIETWIAPAGLTAEQALSRYREGHLERMQMRVFR
jgi:predicted Fe-Mo cluster-binding NifX family protein